MCVVMLVLHFTCSTFCSERERERETPLALSLSLLFFLTLSLTSFLFLFPFLLSLSSFSFLFLFPLSLLHHSSTRARCFVQNGLDTDTGIKWISWNASNAADPNLQIQIRTQIHARVDNGNQG